MTYTYTYDDNGNILSVNDGINTTSYVYDSANQLIRENNQRRNITYVWTYDNAGNILDRKQYTYTTGEITSSTPKATNSYTYGDEDWGDLLTAYNGAEITYDEIGNPLSDGTSTYTWEHGRQLATQTKNGVEWTYTYDANGMRTSRTSDTKSYSYVYSGDKLVQMTITDHTTTPETVQLLEFAYDAAGQPLMLTLDGTRYYYVLNIQGDVTGLVDEAGNIQILYYYEGYGEGHYLSDTSDMTSTLVAANPLAYRGYVMDIGTAQYYLQSRYYNPKVGRFLNADGLVSTGQGLLGNNMFAYCGNNPVMFSDSSGTARIPCTVNICDGGGGYYGGGQTTGSPVVGQSSNASVCTAFGLALVSWISAILEAKDSLPENRVEVSSSSIDWRSGDRNHILKGTKKKHVSGWKRFGIDPQNGNSHNWGVLITILQEVVDDADNQIEYTLSDGSKYIKYFKTYSELGVEVVVKVWVSADGIVQKLSDAIPKIIDG